MEFQRTRRPCLERFVLLSTFHVLSFHPDPREDDPKNDHKQTFQHAHLDPRIYTTLGRSIRCCLCTSLDKIDEGVFLAFAGISADGRVLASKIRLECQSYRYSMGAAPSVGYIARYVGESTHTVYAGCVADVSISLAFVLAASLRRPQVYGNSL